MKFVSALLLLAVSLVLGALPSHAASAGDDILRVRGTDYVRLTEWARVKGMRWRWLKRDESLQLTNQTARFLMLMDSREARVNGLQLWLLFPLIAHEGEVFISRLDADNTLRPLLGTLR